jgi:hypothetical protein
MSQPEGQLVPTGAVLVHQPPLSRRPAEVVRHGGDVNYPWLKAGRIRIDAGEGQPAQSSTTLPVAPADTRTTWMYLKELNTLLLFSAGNASLEWTGPEVDRP